MHEHPEHPGTRAPDRPSDQGERQQGGLEFGPAYRLEQLEQSYLFEKGLLVVMVPL
jgi:hypothetical protein